MQHTMSEHRQSQLVETLLDQLRPILCAFVAQIGEHPLHELEAEVSQVGQQLAQQLLTTTVGTVAPAYPDTTVPCRCGATATYLRRRSATVITQVGRITYRRPYYLCATCRQGQCPLDAQLGWCAGSLSATVQQHLATLGATLPFARAAQLFADLRHVQVSAPTVRRATQQVGQQVAALPSVAGAGPYQPHYVSADGVMVAVRGEGWKEVRVGSVYTTRQRRHGPRAHRMRYCAEVGDLATFGHALAALSTACGGGDPTGPCLVLADGARWVDTLATTHWPQATRIVDWYHAVAYLHTATQVLQTAGVVDAAWAEAQESALWAGQTQAVIDQLHPWAWKWPEVARAETYYLFHWASMQYANYRSHGWLIGSGTIESACKQVVQARCKAAGMRWSRLGVQHVLAVRTRLLGDEWSSLLPFLHPPARSYQRKAA